MKKVQKKLLKKKTDLAIEFLNKYSDKFRCPLCSSDIFILPAEKSVQCENHHTFDISKKGSLQLVNKFVKTEYDQALFTSRTEMMAAGLFKPVFSKIAENIQDDEFVIDAGSGEGSALIDLANNKKVAAVGFDLSNQGIQASTRGLAEGNLLFVVGNLANLPLKDQSVDTIINLLSPASYQEFKRVLKTDGQILKIIPNSQYLHEIREFVAEKNPHINSTYENTDVIKNLQEHFSQIEVVDINYNFALNTPELKANMFGMTPLTWSLDEEIKQEFIKSSIDNITIDLQMLKIRK